MPTDEQRKREQFEADVVASSPTGASLNFTQDGVGGYMSGFMHHRWLGWLAGLQARDAEVQALREQVDHAKRIFQNAEVRSGYCVCGDTPERHGLYAEACQYTDRGQWESELWLKRAALAGGEKGETE